LATNSYILILYLMLLQADYHTVTSHVKIKNNKRVTSLSSPHILCVWNKRLSLDKPHRNSDATLEPCFVMRSVRCGWRNLRRSASNRRNRLIHISTCTHTHTRSRIFKIKTMIMHWAPPCLNLIRRHERRVRHHRPRQGKVPNVGERKSHRRQRRMARGMRTVSMHLSPDRLAFREKRIRVSCLRRKCWEKDCVPDREY
jgi:hypothetical protein